MVRFHQDSSNRPLALGALTVVLLWVGGLALAAQEAAPGPPSTQPGAAATSTTTVDAVRRRGTLRYTSIPEQMNAFLALDLEAFKTTGARRGKGIDYDLIKMLADQLGVELELVTPDTPSLDRLWHCLEQGCADIAVGALSILPERTRRFDFSEPYYQTDLAVVGRKGSPWKTIDETRGLRQSLIPGAAATSYWMKLANPDGEIAEAEFTIGLLSQVAEGLADVGIEDYALARTHLDQLPELEILFTVPIDDHYGIAFRKGSELVPLMNEILARLKTSGELQTIIERHLAASPKEGLDGVVQDP